MSACFSDKNQYASPPIFVLSNLNGLSDSMRRLACPGLQIRHINVSDISSTSKRKDMISCIKNTEIAVCDADLLIALYTFMPSLKWVQLTWAGIDPLLEFIPNKPPFVVTRHAGDSFTKLMAEYVICHVLNCERRTKECWKSQESKIWLEPEKFKSYRSLNEITVAVLGVGNMGSAVAEIFKSRGSRILGFAKHKRPEISTCPFDEISTNLDAVLPNCDYLCNTLPSTPLTSDLLTTSVLSKCLKQPVFINVGRGSIISESSLVDSLNQGLLSQAILDVFETEPLPKSSQLWNMPQVTITPHVSALSRPDDIAKNFFQNFQNYVDGRGLKNVVEWSESY